MVGLLILGISVLLNLIAMMNRLLSISRNSIDVGTTKICKYYYYCLLRELWAVKAAETDL